MISRKQYVFNNSEYSIFTQVWHILIVVCIILNSGYAFATANHNISLYILIPTFFFTFLIINYKLLKFDLTVAFLALFIIFSVVSTFFNLSSTNINAFLRMIMIVILSFFVSKLIEFDTFTDSFVKIMVTLTFIAVCAHLIFITFKLPIFNNIFINTNGSVYYNGYIFFLRKVGTSLSPRSMSVFWEPGLYASYLIISLMLEISLKRNVNKFNVTILILGVLISQSTAGYLLLLFLIPLIRYKNFKKKYVFQFILSVAACLFLFFKIDGIIRYLIKINYDMFYKLHLEELVNSVRFKSALMNLNIFYKSPLFGNGYAGANNIYLSLMNSWGNISQTSTSTYFLAALGIFGALYTIMWFISMLNFKRVNILSRIIILIVMIIIINKEPHQGLMLSYCLLFYFMNESKSEKVKEEKFKSKYIIRNGF